MKIIEEKELKGYQYADGVHWHWGEEEIAIINNHHEIEWCVRCSHLPDSVVKRIRELKPIPNGRWVIEIFKESPSVFQGYYSLCINGKQATSFAAKKILGEDGEYHFDIPDEDLGRLVNSFFYHKYDNVYHYSDQVKDIFYPKWREADNN